MLHSTQTFRIFVSSVFDGLKPQRDALDDVVFPALRAHCDQAGARLQWVDLRWGVRDEAACDHRTMEICNAEIDRCLASRTAPNFIVLLGSRYGWRPVRARIPSDEFLALRQTIAKPEDRELVNRWFQRDDNANPPEYLLMPREGEFRSLKRWRDVEAGLLRILGGAAHDANLPPESLGQYGKSATHLEILRGLGSTAADRERVFLFCEDVAQAQCPPELWDLRRFLEQQLPAENVASYPVGDISAFCKAVEGKLRPLIQSQTAAFASLPALDMEAAVHTEFGSALVEDFVGRQEILAAVEEYLRDDVERRTLVLHGLSGAGKSAIMAASAARFAATEPAAITVRRFIGITPDSADGATLLRGICRDVLPEPDVGPIESDFNAVSDGFVRVLESGTSGRPLYLFLDALDRLDPRDPARSLTWLPEVLPPHCHVVVSAAEVPARLASARLVEVPPLSGKDCDDLLKTWFRKSGRRLQAEQSRKLGEFSRSCSLPLYLRFAFEEARRWRSFDPVDRCRLGNGLSGMIDVFLDRISDARDHGPLMVSRSLSYLAAARFGLTEDELLDILSTDDDVWLDFQSHQHHSTVRRRLPFVLWSRLFHDLEAQLTERNTRGGRAVTPHSRVLIDRIAAMFMPPAEVPTRHRAMANYFERAADPSGGHTWRAPANGRALEELPYHLAHAGLPGQPNPPLRELLRDVLYLDRRCRLGMLQGLLADFSRFAASDDGAGAFLRLHAQNLNHYPDALLGQIWLEGPPELKDAASARIAASGWPDPWLRAEEHWKGQYAVEGDQALVVDRIYSFPNRVSTAMATAADRLFFLRKLGRVAVVDAVSARESSIDVRVTAAPAPWLFASPCGQYLAVATQAGSVEIHALSFTAEGDVSGQTRVGEYPYLLPEADDPAMLWNGDALCYQQNEVAICVLRAAQSVVSPTVLPLNCRGEITALAWRGDWLAAAVWDGRRAAVVSLMAGNTAAVRTFASRVCSLAFCGASGLAVGLRDGTLAVLDEYQLVGERRLDVGVSMDCIVGGPSALTCLVAGGTGFHVGLSDMLARKFHGLETALGSDPLAIRHAVHLSDSAVKLVTRERFVSFHLTGERPTVSYPVAGMFVDGDAVRVLERRPDAVWLVDCTTGRSLEIQTNKRTGRKFDPANEYLFAVNTSRQAIVASNDGTAQSLDLDQFQRLGHFRIPTFPTAAAADGLGGFWLLDRDNRLFSLAPDGFQELPGIVPFPDARPRGLFGAGEWLIWSGLRMDLPATTSAGEEFAEYATPHLVFFQVLHGRRLHRLGHRYYHREEGYVSAICSDAQTGRLFVSMEGSASSDSGLVVRYGTPREFIDRRERTCEVARLKSVLSLAFAPRHEVLFCLAADGSLQAARIRQGQSRSRLLAAHKPSFGWKRLANPPLGDGAVVILGGDNRIYRCRLQE
jgi:hypothetical protein